MPENGAFAFYRPAVETTCLGTLRTGYLCLSLFRVAHSPLSPVALSLLALSSLTSEAILQYYNMILLSFGALRMSLDHALLERCIRRQTAAGVGEHLHRRARRSQNLAVSIL